MVEQGGDTEGTCLHKYLFGEAQSVCVAVNVSNRQATVFARSDAVATICFMMQFCVATI